MRRTVRRLTPMYRPAPAWLMPSCLTMRLNCSGVSVRSCCQLLGDILYLDLETPPAPLDGRVLRGAHARVAAVAATSHGLSLRHQFAPVTIRVLRDDAAHHRVTAILTALGICGVDSLLPVEQVAAPLALGNLKKNDLCGVSHVMDL